MARKLGDRKDATLIRDADTMHFLMGLIYPKRTDNEAFLAETVDLSALDAYLEKKNAANPAYQYNLFQFIVAAYLKALVLRPKLNRFFANGNYYQRNRISAAFLIKKKFDDQAEEGFAYLYAEPTWTFEDVHNDIYRQVTSIRGGKDDATLDRSSIFTKLPRFISKTAVRFVVKFMDPRGLVPQSMIETDPGYASLFFSNLGSIKLNAADHHLANWGTNSMFITVGLRKKRPFYDDDGHVTMKNSVEIGLTIDERIADGYYYAGTFRLLRKLFEHPELIERPFHEEVEY